MPVEKLTTTQIKMIILALMLSLGGVMGIDIFLPALPAMQLYFHTSSHLMALSVPIYVITIALALLYYGPLSDTIGRRKVFMIGYSIGIVGILICLWAHSITEFLVGRLIMGLGIGALFGLVRAMFADFLSKNQLAIYVSYVSLIMGGFVLLSPLIGGYLTGYGWQAIFIFLLLFCLVAITSYLLWGYETNLAKKIGASHPRVLLKNYLIILRSKQFIAYTLASSLAMSSNICYLSLSAFVLQGHFHMSPITFGWMAVLIAFFGIIGKSINTILLRYLSLKKCIQFGYAAITLSGVLLMLGIVTHQVTLVYFLSCIAINGLGCGFIFSNASVGAITSFNDMRGAVAALFGCCQFALPAMSSSCIALFSLHAIGAISMAYLLTGMSGLVSLYLLLGAPKKSSDQAGL